MLRAVILPLMWDHRYRTALSTAEHKQTYWLGAIHPERKKNSLNSTKKEQSLLKRVMLRMNRRVVVIARKCLATTHEITSLRMPIVTIQKEANELVSV